MTTKRERELKQRASDLRVRASILQTYKTRDQGPSMRQQELLDEAESLEIRARITELHRIARETEWRSTAYKAKVEIIDLKARLKKLRRRLRKPAAA